MCDSSRRLTITELRKLIKKYVSSDRKLSPEQVLQKAAAYRFLTEEEFIDLKKRSKDHKVKSIEWPDKEPLPVVKTKKRADVAQRLKDAKNIETDVVTVTWNRFAKEPAKELPVLKSVDDTTRVLLEAYELANLFVLESIKSSKPLCMLDQKFFYQCCVAVCVTEEGNRCTVSISELDNVAKMYHEWKSSVKTYKSVCNQRMRPMFQVLSQDMSVALVNMVDSVFFKRLYKYIKCVLDCSSKYARNVYKSIFCKDSITDPFVNHIKSILPKKQISSSTVHEYLPILWLFNRALRKSRSLCPHKKGFKPSMLTINNNTLRTLLMMADQKVPSEATFIQEKSTWWNRLFHISKLETKNRFFRYEILTDGRSVKVVMGKLRKEKVSLTEKSKYPSLKQAQPMFVASMDPGMRSPATSAACVIDSGNVSIPDIKSTSLREYRQWSFQNRLDVKENRWLQESKKMASIMNELKDTKRNFQGREEARRRIVCILNHLDDLQEFYGGSGFRNNRLTRFIGTKRALEKVCMTITRNRKDPHTTIVGVGDWGKSSSLGIKCACGPYQRIKKELKKYATVIDIDESYTSKTCNVCKMQRMKNMWNWKLQKNNNKVPRLEFSKVHSVLHCTSSVCKGKRTWNRDDNAALNILEITLTILLGGLRPTCFSDQYG
jgi:hypothetical protein